MALFKLIATFMHTLLLYCGIPGLADWSASLELVLLTMESHDLLWDPWRALDGRYGSDIHTGFSETSRVL